MEVDFLGECNTFSILRIAEKVKKNKGSQAPELPLHLANLVRRRRGRRAIPSRDKDSKVIARSESGAEDTINTLEAEVFARKREP